MPPSRLHMTNMRVWCLLALCSTLCTGDELCDEFEQLKYLGPYNRTDHERLVRGYFPGFRDQVVYAQSASCSDYKGCSIAEYRSLYGCGAFSSVTGCIERWDGGKLGDPAALIFDKCKNDQCVLELTDEATKCVLNTWWSGYLENETNGTCISDPDEQLLKRSSFSLFDSPSGWGHCYMALPRDTMLSLQVTCHEPGNVPRMKWYFKFPTKLSKQPFSCTMLSRCSNMDDPMLFLCLSGNRSVEILRDIGSSTRLDALTNRSDRAISNFAHTFALCISLFLHFWMY